MRNLTSAFANVPTFQRREQASRLIASDPAIGHVVVGYGDENNWSFEANPTFLVFDNESEWDSWVALYQPTGSIDAVHR